MKIDSIIKLLDSIKSPYLLTIIVVVIFFLYIFKTDIASIFKSIIFKKKKVNKIKELNDHDVFNTLRSAVNEVKIMRFYTYGEYDSIKSRMCYDFTNHKSEACAKHMKILLNTEGIDKLNKNALRSIIIKTQDDIHKDYIESIRALWISKGIEIEDVKYIVDLFDKFRYDVIKSFENRITAFFSCSYYDTNFDMLLAVFDMWSMGIDLLPRDMQITFETLNGKFKALDY